MECNICERKDTKYKCTNCGVSICNVCAIPVNEEYPGYDESNYCVGKCPANCVKPVEEVSGASVGDNIQDDMLITAVSKATGNASEKPKRTGKQSSISNFFTTSNTVRNDFGSKRKLNVGTGGQIDADVQSKRKCDNKKAENDVECAEAGGSKGNSKRKVSVETIESNWRKQLARDDFDIWFDYTKDGSYAVHFRCRVCIKFENDIKNMKGFNYKWITGSENYKISNARDHCDGDPHKHAMKCYYKAENIDYIEEREENQSALINSFAAGDERTAEQIKKKFEVAYFVTKEEMALKKYPKLLKLEEMHGVDVGQSYRSDVSCAEFIDYIGEAKRQSLSEKIKNANFFSILFDGATDNATKDQEGVYILLFDPHPTEKGKRDKVEVKLNFLGIKSTKASDGGSTAPGVKHGIDECFEEVGLPDYASKLIGFCADGANVNKGSKTGVMAELNRLSPWLVFIWCLSHRLELAIKESLEDTPAFKNVDEMLLQIYLLYEKSPKKLAQLSDLHLELQDLYEFEQGGLKPLRSSGTRWIAHKTSAMRLLIDKFGLYMQHLQEIVDDKSYKNDQRAKVKGFLTRWRKTSMLLNLGFYLELLQPASYLSLALQKEELDPVRAIDALLKIKKRLVKLKETSIDDFSHLAAIKRKSEINDDGHNVYEGVVLKQMDVELERLNAKKSREVTKIDDIISARLNDECSILKPVAKVLNCEGWVQSDDAEEEDWILADKEIKELYQRFKQPLKKSGVNINESEMLDEWHDMVRYALTYLCPEKSNYLKTWRRIFDCSRSQSDFKNILLLIEICFVMPLSNAEVERMFSRMKRVKSKMRCRMSNHRLGHLLRVGEDRKELTPTTVLPAIALWNKEKIRRPNQSK